MRSVAIVTDESANLEKNFARAHKISIIPFNVLNKKGKLITISSNQEEKPEDGLFQSKDSFFRYLEKIKKKEDIPSTGAVTVEKCKQFIMEASQGKKDVVCIHVPKELSKIFENVERAAEIVSNNTGCKVKVVDSKQAFSAQYFIVKEAAELAARGEGIESIVNYVKRIKKRVYLLVGVYKLRYLRKGGRVRKLKKVASLVADWLRLSSVITLKDGVPVPVATIPRSKVESWILDEIERIVGFNEEISVRINYSGQPTRNKAERIIEALKNKFKENLKEITFFQIGTLVGTHTGPYTLSVAVRKHGYQEITSETLAEMFKRSLLKLKKNESTLNRLNIYPVIDADTGRNFVYTLSNLAENLDFSSIEKTTGQIAWRACENGTGFSGTAMAAYLSGFSSYLAQHHVKKLEGEALVAAMEAGTESAYLSFRRPREGTILSTMRVSAQRARECLRKEKDIAEILKEAYIGAVKELLESKQQEIPILKRKGIVDAGGLAFVDTLEGWLEALGKQREVEEFIEDFRKKIKKQKSTLTYKRQEAKHPGFCLKIRIEGLVETAKEQLAEELESLPNPIDNPFSTVSNIIHIHVYNQELLEKVMAVCQKYGRAYVLKKSPLSQKEFELIKNKILSILGKLRALPKLIAWSVYWFGFRLFLPFREIRLWKRTKDLILVSKALEDVAERKEAAIFIFDKKRKIKYSNKAADDYAHQNGIKDIKRGDDVSLYMQPDFLREVKDKLFYLGKNESFRYSSPFYSIELRQVYVQDKHMGAKIEIRRVNQLSF